MHATATQSPSTKQQTDLAYGAVKWGKRLGGMIRLTFDSCYIKGMLTSVQRSQLFAAYQKIDRVYGEHVLKPEEKHEQIASLFNSWQIAQCNKDHVGFGGKITQQPVRDALANDGQIIVMANLGLHPTAPLPDRLRPFKYRTNCRWHLEQNRFQAQMTLERTRRKNAKTF
jgi:hypothetical protein